jgi:hypothetical protein
MTNLGELFGKNSIAQQFLMWNVLSGQAMAAMGPELQALQAAVWRIDPNVPLAVGIAAQLVARGLLSEADGRHAAASVGIDSGPFDLMVDAVRHTADAGAAIQSYQRGDIGIDKLHAAFRDSGIRSDWWDELTKLAHHGPDLSIALEAERRGLVDAAKVDDVLAELGIRQDWWATVRKMAIIPPSPAEALNAYLEGQVSREVALKRYTEGGGDPTWFQHAFDTVGQAPTPIQALELLNRGIIPESGTGPAATSYEQAFLEGPWRNKWLPKFLALKDYLPPPRTVTAMLRAGSIPPGRAAELLAKQGLAPDLVAAYIADAQQQSTAASRDLTKTTIIDLYAARIIKRDQCTGLLTALGYDSTEAAYEIALADLRRSIAAVNSAIARVHSLYVGHKISRDDAIKTLKGLAVPQDQLAEIVHVWDLEESVNVKQLSEAQIVSAFKHSLIDQGEATSELVATGYTAYDAWILLSNAAGGALPGKPGQGPNPIGVLP